MWLKGLSSCGTSERSKMNKIIKRSIILIIYVLAGAIITGCVGDKEETSIDISEEASNYTSSENSRNTKTGAEESSVVGNESIIYVDIVGQVRKPGVYQLHSGDRLYQLIDKAGGFTKKASRESVNLASEVADGQQVVVLSKNQYKAMQGEGNANVPDTNTGDGDALIDINNSSKEILMTLPGIGESKADAIILYREENGSFASIEDIMNVNGIKEAAFNKIKKMIKV